MPAVGQKHDTCFNYLACDPTSILFATGVGFAAPEARVPHTTFKLAHPVQQIWTSEPISKQTHVVDSLM